MYSGANAETGGGVQAPPTLDLPSSVRRRRERRAPTSPSVDRQCCIDRQPGNADGDADQRGCYRRRPGATLESRHAPRDRHIRETPAAQRASAIGEKVDRRQRTRAPRRQPTSRSAPLMTRVTWRSANVTARALASSRRSGDLASDTRGWLRGGGGGGSRATGYP